MGLCQVDELLVVNIFADIARTWRDLKEMRLLIHFPQDQQSSCTCTCRSLIAGGTLCTCLGHQPFLKVLVLQHPRKFLPHHPSCQPLQLPRVQGRDKSAHPRIRVQEHVQDDVRVDHHALGRVRNPRSARRIDLAHLKGSVHQALGLEAFEALEPLRVRASTCP